GPGGGIRATPAVGDAAGTVADDGGLSDGVTVWPGCGSAVPSPHVKGLSRGSIGEPLMRTVPVAASTSRGVTANRAGPLLVTCPPPAAAVSVNGSNAVESLCVVASILPSIRVTAASGWIRCSVPIG